MEKNLKMRNTFILVELSTEEKENYEKKGSLIVLKPTTDNKQYESGKVISLGEKVNSSDLGGEVNNPIKVGDTIIFDRYAARPYKENFAIVSEDKVVAIEP